MPARSTAARTALLALALGLVGTPAAGAATLGLALAGESAPVVDPQPAVEPTTAPAPVLVGPTATPAEVEAPVEAAPAPTTVAELVAPAAPAPADDPAFTGPVAPVAPAAALATGVRTTSPLIAMHASLLSRASCTATTTCAPVRKRRWLGNPVATTAPVAAPRSLPLATPSPTPTASTRPVVAPLPLPVVPSASPLPTAQPVPTPVVVAPVVPTVAPTVVPAPEVPTTPPAARVKQFGASAFRGEVGELTHVGELAYLQLNAWEADRAAALKAQYPGLKVLVYKDMSSTRSYAVANGRDDAKLPTGVGYVEAGAHPDWFLEDTTGARMLWPYEGHWWMDVANPGYQQAWAANVRAELAAGPWDGVVIDNVMASPEWYLGDRTIARYPTRDAYERATESFLTAVAPLLKADGKLAIGNISDAWPTTWDRWTGLLSGGNHEHSFLWNNGSHYGGNDWLGRVEEIERTQRAGRIHTATSEVSSTDVPQQTWVRASWLMAWDGGRSGSAQFVGLKDQRDPWNAVVATDLGQPVGPRTAVGGAWRRDFTAGTALANPSSATVTVALGRTMTDLSGRRVSSVVLAPLTGALLRP